MSCVFGPVPSRRLGRSLGVDPIPLKTCTYDCLYCQLGRTTCRTVQRKEWLPLEQILADVKAALSSRPDYITLSGSGEPTLFSRTGELIDGIKAMTAIPVAVLTNGSLLWQDEVRRQLGAADVVVPSLDAGSAPMFRAVNRPHEQITFDKLLEGLIKFRETFRGECWLEVLLLAGYTGIEAEAAKLSECIERIKPHRVQLNTVTRPPAEDVAAPVPPGRLAELAALIRPDAEVIAEFPHAGEHPEFAAGQEEVLNLLRRRPCRIEDIARGLAMHRNEVVKHVEDLSSAGLLTTDRVGGEAYYRAAGSGADEGA